MEYLRQLNQDGCNLTFKYKIMLVKEIELVNFKTIESFKHEFKGGIYLITGENEVGKTTLLNAIVTLLTGNRSANLLKQGKEKGFAKIKVGDYEVEIKFTEKNPRGTFTITAESGLTSNNISMLEKIFDYQDFDAHDFVSWSQTAEGRRKQVEAVKSLLPEDARKRLEEIEIETSSIREERKEANVSHKNLQSVLSEFNIDQNDIDKYSNKLELMGLFDSKNDIQEKNRQIEDVSQRQEERREKLNGFDSEIDIKRSIYGSKINDLKAQIKSVESEMEDKIEGMESERKDLKDKSDKADVWLKENAIKDLDEINEKINSVEYHNEKHNKIADFKENKAKLGQVEKKRNKFNSDLDSLVSEKEDIIKKSKIPVDGLTFTDDGLFLNGIPFAPGEVSTSQEMEVAAKLIIAKNPKVKVFRIAQGESLGQERLNSIVRFAKKNGYQGFIEEVKRGQNDLVIEEYTEKF